MTSILSVRTGWKATTTSGTGSQQAFTLVELVIAIAVVSILAGFAVPAIDGVQKERLAREPVSEILSMAREVRNRAMAEQRPYQIIFERDGVRASRFFQPYGGREEFDELRIKLEQREQLQQMIEASRARGIAMEEQEPDLKLEAIEEGMAYLREYHFDPQLRVSVKFWDETQWASISNGEFRRWVFQPSGMCEPIRVKVEADDAFFEVEFHPLTADIKSERSWVE